MFLTGATMNGDSKKFMKWGIHFIFKFPRRNKGEMKPCTVVFRVIPDSVLGNHAQWDSGDRAVLGNEPGPPACKTCALAL